MGEQWGIKNFNENYKPTLEFMKVFSGIMSFSAGGGGGGGGGGMGISINPSAIVESFALALQKSVVAIEGFNAKLEVERFFKKPSDEDIGVRLKKMNDEYTNPANNKMKEYYAQQGITFRQNTETLSFEAIDKNGKVIEANIKSLDEVAKSLSWILDSKHAESIAKVKENGKNFDVKVDLKTGQLAVFDGDKLVKLLGYTHGPYEQNARSYFSSFGKNAELMGVLANYSQQKQEEQLQKKDAENEKIYKEKIAQRRQNIDKNSDTVLGLGAEEYLARQGIAFKEKDGHHQILKDGKLIKDKANKKATLDSVSWIHDSKHAKGIDKLERQTGGDVGVDYNSGQVALFKNGKLLRLLGFAQGSKNNVRNNFKQPMIDSISRSVNLQEIKEDENNAAKEKEKNAAKNSSNDKTITPPEAKKLPSSTEKSANPSPAIMAPEVYKSANIPPSKNPQPLPLPDKKGSEGKPSNNHYGNIPPKQPTARDAQVAQKCLHMENSNNNYKYDVKIIVKPTSGDPIQIARQVCEQLKHHTCGKDEGFSKKSTQNAQAIHI